MFQFDMRLNQPFEDFGVWWQPQYPDRKINGRIRYSPDSGIHLDCADWLVYEGIGHSPRDCLLHGEVNTFGPTTLFHAFGSLIGLQKVVHQSFSVGSLLVGAHVNSFDHQYSGIRLKLSQLNDWFSTGPFGYDYDQEGISQLVEYHFQYDPTELPVYDIPNIDCQLGLGFTSSQTGFGHSVTLSHDVYINVYTTSDKPLSELIEIAHDLELLVTLMAGFASPIFSLALIPPSGSSPTHDQHYLYSRSLRQIGRKLFHRGDMPANFEFVQSTFGSVLNKWFIASRKFSPVIRLLRATLFSPPSPFIENRFLSVAQALEGYCRIATNEMHLPRSEFGKIKEAMRGNIPADVPEGFRELLKNRIGRMNEYSLRDRVLSLFERHEWLRLVLALTKGQVPANDEVNAFAKQFVDARNSLTHVEAGQKAMGIVDYRTFSLVRDILCLLLLHEAGIHVEETYRRIHNELGTPWWWLDEVFV